MDASLFPIVIKVNKIQQKTTKADHMSTRPIEDRFWEKVEKAAPDDCWHWHGAQNESGYGRFGWPVPGGKRMKLEYAHRAAFMLTHGIQLGGRGDVIMHSCDNPRCVNPAHLARSDQSSNIQDCANKKRLVNNTGSRNGRSVLNEDDVRQIRVLNTAGHSMSDLAVQFGCCRKTIANALNRRFWKHV